MSKSELEGHLAALHVKEQEEIIAQSEELCATILKIVKSDVLSVETEHFTDSTFGTRSTVRNTLYSFTLCRSKCYCVSPCYTQ